LALTVGLAVNRTYQQSEESKVSLAQFRQGKNLFENLVEEIRWCSQIHQLTSTLIRVTCPDIDNLEMDNTVTYCWNTLDQNVYRSSNGVDFEVFLSGVYFFEIQACDFGWNGDGQRYVRSLLVTVQLSANEEDCFQKYIHLSNFPLW
jgi:hypothetical protein